MIKLDKKFGIDWEELSIIDISFNKKRQIEKQDAYIFFIDHQFRLKYMHQTIHFFINSLERYLNVSNRKWNTLYNY